MARAGLARLADASFEKDGKQISYRTARLTQDGKAADAGATEIVIKDISALASGKKRKKKSRAPKAGRGTKKRATDATAGVEAALRAWRMAEAKRAGVPAFRVFSDRTLLAIAEALPATPEEFLAVPGIGLRSVEKYGQQIYRICSKH
jgi:DNA topoisomerase-3